MARVGASVIARRTAIATPAFVAKTGLACLLALTLAPCAARAEHRAGQRWIAAWTTSPQGAFAGIAGAALVNVAFPNPTTEGAHNQTLRMIVKPDVWGNTIRLRFSNTFGTQPVTFGHITVGLQAFSGVEVRGTNTPVTFHEGSAGVTISPGDEVFSDAVHLGWVKSPDDPIVAGRNLAVSFFAHGSTGPMTFHRTAFAESFLGAPGSGDHAADADDMAFPYETSSFFFLDAVDVLAPSETRVLVVTGSSSADGWITTPDNNDRFLNWMSRRLHAAYGDHVSVVNEGIAGDTAASPGPGQTRALRQHLPERFTRDVLGVSGVTDVLFYAGVNDFGDAIPPVQSIASLKDLVDRLHAKGVKAIGSTLISNIGQSGTSQATYDAHTAINAFILNSGTFDSTADFNSVTSDSVTHILLPQYSTHSDPNGTPDFLHLGRAGAQAEANALDIRFFAPASHR